MKPLVRTQDEERIVRDVLSSLLAARGETATVGVGVPAAWTLSSPTYVQVSSDGDPVATWPVSTRPTVRVCVWSKSTTTSKALAGLCMGLLLAYPRNGGMAGTRFGTGVLSARDPETRAELSYVTVGVTLRTIPA